MRTTHEERARWRYDVEHRPLNDESHEIASMLIRLLDDADALTIVTKQRDDALRHVLAEEERIKLTGDALQAEGDLAEAEVEIETWKKAKAGADARSALYEAESSRLSALLNEWIGAACSNLHAGISGASRPETLRRRLDTLVAQAGETARLLGEVAKMQAVVDAALDLTGPDTSVAEWNALGKAIVEYTGKCPHGGKPEECQGEDCEGNGTVSCESCVGIPFANPCKVCGGTGRVPTVAT